MTSSNSKTLGIIVIALVALGGVAVIAWALQPGKTPDSQKAVSQNESPTAASHGATSDVVITYSDDGFSPKSPMITKGGTVTVRNTSSQTLEFSSGPHPTHTDEAELNLKPLAPGESTSFTVTRIGTFSFHNHLNESQNGELMVMQ